MCKVAKGIFFKLERALSLEQSVSEQRRAMQSILKG